MADGLGRRPDRYFLSDEPSWDGNFCVFWLKVDTRSSRSSSLFHVTPRFCVYVKLMPSGFGGVMSRTGEEALTWLLRVMLVPCLTGGERFLDIFYKFMVAWAF